MGKLNPVPDVGDTPAHDAWAVLFPNVLVSKLPAPPSKSSPVAGATKPLRHPRNKHGGNPPNVDYPRHINQGAFTA